MANPRAKEEGRPRRLSNLSFVTLASLLPDPKVSPTPSPTLAQHHLDTHQEEGSSVSSSEDGNTFSEEERTSSSDEEPDNSSEEREESQANTEDMFRRRETTIPRDFIFPADLNGLG